MWVTQGTYRESLLYAQWKDKSSMGIIAHWAFACEFSLAKGYFLRLLMCCIGSARKPTAAPIRAPMIPPISNAVLMEERSPQTRASTQPVAAGIIQRTK